ncbi:metal-dependent hydrolase [Paenibacillus sp. 32352]|uniref:metal-dependent hydrolase n=1 Tax=Paenibacillus sp. 32352 TaxID=1969111 RepID=UPI0009AE94D3|nr:metal-dependent hydrolase [Paenibacillus sp. 32352]
MDTASHLLFGATLGGLALLDPVVVQHPVLAHAIMTVTLIGSHAPDFDSIARLKSYTAYIRTHRGITHSLSALFIWPLLLSVPIASYFHVWTYVPLLFSWAMAAVVFHVLLDWFNVYGVQCFRPLSNKWKHLDVLSLFEPFLFVIHSAGVIMWSVTGTTGETGWLFLGIYIITFMYILMRAYQHGRAVRQAEQILGERGACQVLPTWRWSRWQIVTETEKHFFTGVLERGVLDIHDIYEKRPSDTIVQATLAADGVQAFLYFAQRVLVRCKEENDGYLVEWRDVRFWYNHKLPFGVDVQLDRNLNVVNHTLGWRKRVWDPPYV